MHKKRYLTISGWAVALGLGFLAGAQTPGSLGRLIAKNTPGFVRTAKNMGHANTVQTIEVGIWLKPHNRAELDTLVEELYDPNSSHYHDWLKPEDIAAKFAPTAAEARTVATFLSSHNLRVVDIGPDNFLVRARGTLAEVEKAFHVRIDTFELNGKAYRANTSDPYIEGAAAPLVGSVAGLDNLQYEHPLVAQTALQRSAGGKGPRAAASNANTDSGFFTTHCFTGVKTESFSGTDQYSESGFSDLQG